MLRVAASKVGLMVSPLLALCACSPTIDLGSTVIWQADHESGDLSQWTAGNSGGAVAPSTAATDRAHSGSYAARVGLSNMVTLWRQGTFPTEAYYSAWYFLPHDFTQITSWTIMSFGRLDQSDGSRHEVTILNLRMLPGGDIILFVFDDRGAYEQWPLAVPPAVVPVGQWFQLEAFYRNSDDATGRLTIWIDGRQVYDITNRPSGTGPSMYLGIGNVPDIASPPPPEIWVDDVTISLSRAAPGGN